MKKRMLKFMVSFSLITTLSTSQNIFTYAQENNKLNPQYDLVDLSKYNINNTDYNIVWVDDFNNETLNENVWEYELGSIRGIEQQHYVNNKENVFIRNNSKGGELVLKATNRPTNLHYINPRSSDDDKRNVIYNSGSIRTHGQKEFLYGRIEMKAKLPKGKGVFPAFWTLGSDFILDGDINEEQGYGWARCGEIDIMELIGENSDGNGNKTVYQTIHTAGNSSPDSYEKLGGTSYKIDEDFYDDYHIFGINWSKGKIEWYVDDKIVATVNYSNNPTASKALDRPQYIQMNLAMGGAWPGPVGENLGSTAQSEYAIDYIYYAQNEQQKRDAEEYYKNAPKVESAKNLVLYEGDTVLDILNNAKVSENANLDFSITDYPNFKSKEQNANSRNPITSVDLIHKGKNDNKKLSELPIGEYTLYYTALPKNLTIDNYGKPNGNESYKFDRIRVNLTIKERDLNVDLENANLNLDGRLHSPLSTIKLPNGWTWDEPKKMISSKMDKVSATFTNDEGFKKSQSVDINVKY